MCTVPLILDRIYKNLTAAVNKKGPGFKKVFEFCFNHKQRWNEWGYDTPILDRLIFNKLSMILGGRVAFMIVGSAPLSPSTQEFMRTCMPPIKLVQGYTMTETTCAGTCQVPGDMRVGIVGGPMAGMEIRLVDWEEGNYRITDKPYPRGEVVLGGKSVARGYYKNEEKTEEDFFTENGTRFFRSGDIAELREDGTFRLIDRKKDLVKLQLGEYVSLGKVEAQLKTNPVVDNICVYADSLKTHTVAIIVPVKEALERVAKGMKKSQDEFEEICKDNEVVQEVLKKLTVHGKTNGLEKFEIPTAITLCPEVWIPESGLVTAAFKLKRKAIQLAFQPAIDLMYGK
jgi:long-chain acyl-CoA synthetase